MHGVALPPKLLKMIRSALEPGEQIVWTGQPRIGPFVFVVGPMMTAFIVIWLGWLWAFPLVFDLSWVLLYITFVVQVAIPAIVFMGQWWCWRNTAYVITSHRAIAFVPHWRLGYRVYVNFPEDLGCCRVGSFGSLGNIVWAERQIKGTGYLAGIYRGAFVHIDHVREVEQLMHATFLPHLVQGLKSTSPEVRRKSIVSLCQIGRGAKEAIPHLIDALSSEDSFIRQQAAKALGTIGGKASPALPELSRLTLTDESRVVAESARRAAHRIQISGHPC